MPIIAPSFHPPKRGDLFANIQVHVFLLVSGVSGTLTAMDTEHGFSRNLKAIRDGILRLLRAEIFSEKCGASMQPQYPAGQNGGYLGETLVRSQRKRVVDRSQGTKSGIRDWGLESWKTAISKAHSDLRLATG